MATKDLKTTHDDSSAGEDNNNNNTTAPTEKTSSKKRKTSITEIEIDVTQPEPPSKKAKRLLKKGKTLPAKPTSDDDEDGGETTKDGDASKKDTTKKKERSPYGVWIGNLRFSVNRGDLRKWLVDNSGGAITDELITRVHMPTDKPVGGGGGPGPRKEAAKNRGFAYVDFATFEANVAAIALSETEWEGRKVLIKDSKSFDGRPKKEEGADGEKKEDDDDGSKGGPEKKKSLSTKVFVGNLSFTTTEDDLHAHFEKCGKIRWIKVATFEDTGKCKGYGWVNFEEPEAAQWAVKGFVKVRETVDSIEDFIDKDGEDGGEKEEEEEEGNGADEKGDEGEDDDEKTSADKRKSSKKEKEPPRIKTRKWWVNQLLGRNLKIELAEDDQLRYAKRFKKGGQKNREGGEERQPPRTNGSGDGGAREYVKREKKPAYASDISVARLTGAAVAPQGKKTTFE